MLRHECIHLPWSGDVRDRIPSNTLLRDSYGVDGTNNEFVFGDMFEICIKDMSMFYDEDVKIVNLIIPNKFFVPRVNRKTLIFEYYFRIFL